MTTKVDVNVWGSLLSGGGGVVTIGTLRYRYFKIKSILRHISRNIDFE